MEPREKSAVSEPEKKAEKQSSMKIEMILAINRSSKVKFAYGILNLKASNFLQPIEISSTLVRGING